MTKPSFIGIWVIVDFLDLIVAYSKISVYYWLMKFIAIVLLFVSVIGFADDGGWQLKKNIKNIQIYQKQVDGFKLKHHKAISLIAAPVGVVLAVLQDAEACHKWVYKCTFSQTLETTNLKKRIHYVNINSPFLFKDRDMYLQSNIDYYSKRETFIIKLQAVPNYADEHKNRVRIKQVNMVWTIKTVGDRLTEVTYETYLDPLMPINTLVNNVILNSVFHTMRGLNKIVQQQKYQ